MHQPASAATVVRFGTYEVDLRAGELRKGGLKVKLQEQPFQILCMLLQRPGELVTRDELREKLWPNGTFVDFEHSLNTSVKKLREALGDEADNPRFIETLHRRGYRFVAPVEGAKSSVVVTDNPFALEGQNRRAPWRSTRVLLIAILTIAGLTGAIFEWRGLIGVPLPKVSGSRRLTSGNAVGVMSPTRGNMLFPALLTDGSRLYFSEWDDMDNYKVSQVSTAGGEISHLPLSFGAIVLHLSPDSEKLLIREVTESLEGPLWEVSTTGGNPIRLGDVLAQDGAWSPDGKKLLFSKGNELYVANRGGTDARKLLGLNGRAYWIRWSLDGRRLRFTLVDKNLGMSLWEVAEDGTGLHRLLPAWKETAQDCCGDWSRDGRYFVFTAVQDNQPNIWILPEKVGVFGKQHNDPVQMTLGPDRYPTAIFSQDGTKLFAVSRTKLGGLTRFNLKTRELEPFLKGFRGSMVDYSRDDRWITYVIQAPIAGAPSGDVWRSRADGNEGLQLTSRPLNAMYPRWSPDGKQIAFIGKMQGGPYKLYLIGKDGGTPKQLIGDERNEIDPDWSPDGRKIIFGRPPDSFAEPGIPKAIHLLDVESGQVSTLPGSQGLFAPRWSRDGRYVFALTVETPYRMLLYDVATKKWRKLGIAAADGSWAHDSKSIFAAGEGKKGEYLAYRIWLDGRIESVVDLHKVSRTTLLGCNCCWNGTVPDNSPLMNCSSFSNDLYALDLDLP